MGFVTDAIEDLGNAVSETFDYITSPEGIITSAAIVTGQYYMLGSGFTWAAAGKAVLVNAGLNGAARALAPEPQEYVGRTLSELASQGSRFQFTSPVATRSYSYGAVRTSGVIVQIKTTDGSGGDGTNYLHICLAISGRPQTISEVYLNEVDIYDGATANAPRDAASGTTPDYSSKVQYQVLDGDATNSAYGNTTVIGTPTSNPDANDWMPDFLAVGFANSSDREFHMGVNITKLGLRMLYDATLFAEGIPRISVEMQGVDTTNTNITDNPFTVKTNPAACILDYLTNEEFGLNVEDDEIDFDSFQSAYDICDENVTEDDGITVTRRYSCNGIVDSSKTPQSILEDLLQSCAGSLAYTNGKFKLLAGAWRTPTKYIDEDDLAGAVTINTKNDIRDQINRIKVQYYDDDIGQVRDAPIQEVAGFLGEDLNYSKPIDMVLPFTNNEFQAIRLAKITLKRVRKQLTITLRCKMTCFDVEVGDNVYFSYENLGYTNKTFECVSWQFFQNDGQSGVEIVLKEIDADVFSNDLPETEFFHSTITPSSDNIEGAPNWFGTKVDSTDFPETWTDNVDKYALIDGDKYHTFDARAAYAKGAIEIDATNMGGRLFVVNRRTIFGNGATYSSFYQEWEKAPIYISGGSGSEEIFFINEGSIKAAGGKAGDGGDGADCLDADSNTLSGGDGGRGGFGAGYYRSSGAAGGSFYAVGQTGGDGNAGESTVDATAGTGGTGGTGGNFGQDGANGSTGGDATSPYGTSSPEAGQSGIPGQPWLKTNGYANVTVVNRGTIVGNIDES